MAVGSRSLERERNLQKNMESVPIMPPIEELLADRQVEAVYVATPETISF